MNTAIEGCNSLTRSGQDLPTKLKIASISTRFNNLKHDGDKLLVIFITKPIDTTPQRRNSKAKSRRSDSASASELAIKQTLANLQSTFTSYKKAFERRLVSHRTGGPVSTSSEYRKQQSDISGVTALGAVRLRTKSEVKPSVPIATSPSRTRNMAGENHVGPIRPRTQTANHQPDRDSQSDKDKSPSHNVVKDKVASFNKRAQEEEQIQMPNFGITFDIRPRAKTADPSVGREGKGGVSPRHRANAKAVPEKPELEREAKTTTKAEESPVDVASVPLRRNRGRGRGGLSKDERRQKIAAIRELFETSDLSNIVSEPGRQWKPAHLPDHSPAKRSSAESVRKTSEDSSSVLTQNSSLESGSGTSLSESGQPAFTSSASLMDNVKPTTSVDQQVPAATAKAPEETKAKIATSGQTDSTTYNGTASTVREQAMSLSVLVSPPAETRTRLHTAPAIYKTVVKDLSGTKQQVRTLNIEETPTPAVMQAPLKAKPTHPLTETGNLSPDIPVFKGGSLERNFIPDQSNFMRDTRATRSMSPQQRRRMEKGNLQSEQSTTSPGRTRRPPLLQVAGKVSSLRSMFDSQAQTNAATPSPFMRKRASSESKPYLARPTPPLKLKTVEKSAHQRSSSMDTTHVEKAPLPVSSVIHQRSSSMDTPTDKKLPTPVQEEPSSPPPSQAEVKRAKSPDIIPITRAEPLQPPPPPPRESPLTTSITESSSPHPPPRPPSPVGYLLEKEGDSESELESESEGSIYESDTSSLDEVDLEWVGGEDEVDLPCGFDDPDLPLTEQRMFKSLR